ncbi:hypothetical protein K9U41_19575 [Xanthobacter autotrophicus]|nr:hypothetical protein [Xanthobacter autotrophicus]
MSSSYASWSPLSALPVVSGARSSSAGSHGAGATQGLATNGLVTHGLAAHKPCPVRIAPPQSPAW